MEKFLASVEQRAYIMAKVATGSEDEALDIVQDSMLALVKRYGKKPKELWRGLFYRILQNKIRDWYRRTAVRKKVWSWLGNRNNDQSTNEDDFGQVAGPKTDDPLKRLQVDSSIKVLEKALNKLPIRQQQAFLLRAWEGLNTRETAAAMNCSAGSVKTHYSRATHSLRQSLEGHWP